MGQAGWTQATCGASYGTTSGLCTVKAPLSILLNNNAPNGIANPVFTYGAPNDTVLLNASGAFNSTSGSPNISFGRTIGGNFAGATLIATGCGQLTATAPVVISGGTGYVTGDTVQMTNGLVLTVTWAVGGVVQSASGTNVSPGVAVFGSGAVSSWPGTFTQTSTSGVGTGLTVSMTQTAAPLSTTINLSFTGGTSIPLGANCSQTLTNSTQWVTWGHDNQPQIQSALNSGYATVVLPGPNQVYGIRSTLVMPASTPIILDCQGATIVALNAMTAMIQTTTNGGVFHQPIRSKVQHCILEGMGVVQFGIQQGGDLWDFDDVTVNDATTANVEITKVGSGGSVVINNQYRFQIYNNTTMVPNYPTYCIWIPFSSATDNQFMPGEFWTGCQQAAVYDQTFGTFYQGPIHAYTVPNGPIFNFAGASYNVDDIYPDNPVGSYCGVQLAGSYTRITGWTVLISNSYNLMNQGGVCVTGGNNSISGGVWNAGAVPAANGCQGPLTGSGVHSNIFIDNVGCSLQNPLSPQAFSINSSAALTAGGALNYCPPSVGACSTSAVVNVSTVPRACQLQNFYFAPTNGDIGSGQTYTAALLAAGATTAVSCTITGNGSSTPACSDTTDTAQINAGQTLQVKISTSAGSTAVRVYGAFECLAFH